MIRRLAITTALGAAAAATLIAGAASAAPASSPHVDLAAMNITAPPHPGPHPAPPGHGPGWDGRHGNWDGRSGPGHGGGWDGNGGGWDGHNWWVSTARCRAGHGHVAGANDHRRGFYCQGGIFNGSPVHP
jgi:hypothetical protein